jgi:hypothetical protein
LESQYALIAGVNKAGTTSLFVGLSAHPDVAPSAVKETRYFLPARYGQPLEPAAVWESYFPPARPGQVRLEATPSYVYGGAALATVLDRSLPGSRVIMVLREPVARAISFFSYQKVRLRFPPETTMAQYVAEADALPAAAFQDPSNERYMAVRGGRYADFLPGWIDTFGTDRLLVLGFEDLLADTPGTLRRVTEWIGLDPDAFPEDTSASENRTTGYRSAAFQRVALTVNDRLERLLRRHPDTKRTLRAWYFRVNGRPVPDVVSDELRAELARRYEEPNARLAALLAEGGFALPRWLDRQDLEPTNT